ncbi:MAG: SUF system Fe-S cluster assembly regulator [Rickettsiales bacterium]
MLRLSKMADYAGVIAVHIAREPARVHTAASLAGALGLPKTTVAKCLKALAGAGVLSSQRGVHGGYALAKPAKDISVAEVIYALEGRVQIAACVDGHEGHCQIEKTCHLRGGWNTINAKIQHTLETMSVADMAK